MHVLYLILALVAAVIWLVCWMIIVVDAFKYEIWAGLLAIIFPPYFIYWAIFEFEHDRKWTLVIGALGGIWLAALFFELYMGVPVVRPRSFRHFG
ncbi:MAG: hypothetical protein ACHQ50_01365 [Fimbriimonadales bacterium]